MKGVGVITGFKAVGVFDWNMSDVSVSRIECAQNAATRLSLQPKLWLFLICQRGSKECGRRVRAWDSRGSAFRIPYDTGGCLCSNSGSQLNREGGRCLRSSLGVHISITPATGTNAAIMAIFPTPCNPQTSKNYSIPKACHAHLPTSQAPF